MAKVIAAVSCLLVGAFLAVHGFTSLNLSTTDPNAVYELVINGHGTGVFETGKNIYTSGKALTAMTSVPFLVLALVLIVELLTKRSAPKRRLAILVGAVVALPICGIVLGNALNVVNPWVYAMVPVITIPMSYFILSRSEPGGPSVLGLGK